MKIIYKMQRDILLKKLLSLGVNNIKHIKNSNLYNHLLRTESILKYYNMNENTLLAGLCHSVYSTEFFHTKIIDLSKRKEIQNIIGEESEQVVYFFSIMKRDSLKANNGSFSFINRLNNNIEFISKDTFVALLHIMLANDIDHINHVNIHKLKHLFYKYKESDIYLKDIAKRELYKIINRDSMSICDNNIKSFNDNEGLIFLGHSGVLFYNNKIRLIIDPWLYDSYKESPVIEGFDPNQSTIDYMIPESTMSTADLLPNIVCFSHFHTHHSPLKEIIEITNKKKIKLICPKIDDEKLLIIKNKISDQNFNNIEFIFVDKNTDIELEGVSIKVFKQLHQKEIHLMFFIKINNISISHIVDAKLNNNNCNNDFEDWKIMRDLSPDYLFIGVADHDSKIINNGIRDIEENSTLSSVQAAKLAVIMNSKNVIPSGIYNHSVWDKRFEYKQSVSDAEFKLSWALSFLSPSIKVIRALPGQKIV